VRREILLLNRPSAASPHLILSENEVERRRFIPFALLDEHGARGFVLFWSENGLERCPFAPFSEQNDTELRRSESVEEAKGDGSPLLHLILLRKITEQRRSIVRFLGGTTSRKLCAAR